MTVGRLAAAQGRVVWTAPPSTGELAPVIFFLESAGRRTVTPSVARAKSSTVYQAAPVTGVLVCATLVLTLTTARPPESRRWG